MSLHSDEAELEGDFEDLEGDVDLNEWAAMGEDNSEMFLEVEKPPEQSQAQMKTRMDVSNRAIHTKSLKTCDLPSNQNVKPRKRSGSSGIYEETENSKSNKLDSDILMAIEASGVANESAEDIVDEDHIKEKLSFTQEELRNLDAALVSEMMGGIKKQMFLRMPKGDRFVVAFTPVELADLADPSVQQLIESQPNLAFFFNRQGKFKKKKGYAQAYFTLTSEVRKFLSMLMYVRLMEQSTEVSISAIMNGGKHNVQVSFVVSSDHKGKLIMLLEKEDPDRYVPVTSKTVIQVEKVSSEATAAVLMLLFPFSSSVDFKCEQTKDMTTGYKGPVNVFYTNQHWLDAVMSCCSDFRYNGTPLKFLRKEVLKPAEHHKSSIQTKKESRRFSADSDRKSQSSVQETTSEDESHRSRHASSNSNISGSDKGDDAISNMTLDVCAGMMESLDKLKQMGTDNPNVLKILEMQSQLAALQKSLTKKGKSGAIKSKDDPQEAAMSDITSGDDIQKGTEIKDQLLTKDEARGKLGENKKDNQNNKEIEILEAKLKDAEREQIDREKRLQEEIENERKRAKELEEMRKRNAAKQWIAEALQKKRCSGGTSAAAQKLLKSVADKRRDEQLTENSLNTVQPSRAPHGLETSSQEARGERLDHFNQSWNKNTIQEPGSVPLQENFQLLTSFMENFPGRGQLGQPIPSTSQPDGPDIASAHQQKLISGDVGLQSRLEEFQKELAQQGVVSPVKVHENRRSTISPDRPVFEGAPVYTEKEYHLRRKAEYGQQLPPEFYIQTTFLPNRRCPVLGCPASKTKNFKTEPMFLDHWDMFHKPTMTMRFCQHCTAYFVHPSELHAHLMKNHNVHDHQVATQIVAEARVKIVRNPSFRDPGRFLAPPV